MIEIRNLTKKFGDFIALNGLDLKVEKNRIFGFLGPNGAGKTTTIRMMAGLLKPSGGSIEIAGEKVVFGDTSVNRLFGYLPEMPSFYNWMSGLQYLEFICDVFHLNPKEKKERIKELFDLVGLSQDQRRRIGAYSGGMKQRLGIAQALINQPKVLILDEPVSALDPIGRRDVLQILGELKKTTTIFMSTHILADVDKICDDVAIINKGKLVVQSSLSELKTRYAAPILEVEFNKNSEEIAIKVKDENWVKKVETNGNHLKIFINDEKAVESNLALRTLEKFGVGILHYGLNLPEVEDLFTEAMEAE